MWNFGDNPFKQWTIRVVFEDARPVHATNCHKNVDAKCFEVQLGFVEEEWEGYFFPIKDLPYLEEHEIMHALGLIEGTDEFHLNPIFAYDHELPEIFAATLRNEKRAWRNQLEGYVPIEVLEKIQLFLTDYLIVFDRRLKERGQKGLV